MNEDDRTDNPKMEQSDPRIISPRNAVNVAFPFSNIHIEPASEEIAQLATLVADLAAKIDGPNGELRQRAEALASRLRK